MNEELEFEETFEELEEELEEEIEETNEKELIEEDSYSLLRDGMISLVPLVMLSKLL